MAPVAGRHGRERVALVAARHGRVRAAPVARERRAALSRTPAVRLALDHLGHVTLAREGDALITDSRLATTFPRPPLHVHPGQSERFEVGSGRLRLTVGAGDVVLGAGDALTVAAGVPHTFAVHGGEPVELRATFEPAGRLESFFRGLHALARDGHIDDRGRPRSLAVARFALAHLDEFRLARIPARVQRLALVIAAARAG